MSHLDGDLLARAQASTGIAEESALIREALRALIERESARRLIGLSGADADLEPIPRRKSD